ncbi:hypothetical protein ACP3P8_22345 [Pseudomonas aeruginosa]
MRHHLGFAIARQVGQVFRIDVLRTTFRISIGIIIRGIVAQVWVHVVAAVQIIRVGVRIVVAQIEDLLLFLLFLDAPSSSGSGSSYSLTSTPVRSANARSSLANLVLIGWFMGAP